MFRYYEQLLQLWELCRVYRLSDKVAIWFRERFEYLLLVAGKVKKKERHKVSRKRNKYNKPLLNGLYKSKLVIKSRINSVSIAYSFVTVKKRLFKYIFSVCRRLG